MVERLNQEISRRMRVVGLLVNDASSVRPLF